METRTLSELIADARLYSSLGSGQSITDAQITVLLNNSVRKIVNKLMAIPGARYSQTSADQTLLVAGNGFTPLPTYASRIDRVCWVDGLKEIPVERSSQTDLENFDRTPQTWSEGDVTFSMSANGIQFRPYPDSTKAIRIYYENTCSIVFASAVAQYKFVNLTDTIDAKFGTDQWVVLDTAIQMRIISEESVSDLRKEIEVVDREFYRLALERVAEVPQRIPAAKDYGWEADLMASAKVFT